jgi:hypothetical protein
MNCEDATVYLEVLRVTFKVFTPNQPDRTSQSNDIL